MGDTAIRTFSYPKWNSALSVGNGEIDDEHQDFLVTVGHVAQLIQRGEPAAELREATIVMVAKLKIHFCTEERIFSATTYPEAAAHCSEHKVLLHMADHIREMVCDSEDPVYICLSLRYLAQSVVEHLVETDMGYKPYLCGPTI